ncbi:MAG: outer membrane channel protein [Firmicutes bacterium ADurb.Bin456]|nr:MAG: outer membrane channel protein [Firmicutes bacterium ADurb.Bin456]
MVRRVAVCFTLFAFLFILLPFQALAREPLTPELTLEAAVERALVTNNSLKKAQKDLERAEEVKDYLADKVDFIPSGPVPSSNAESVFLNLTQAEISRNMARRNYKASEDAVVLSVHQAYYEILKSQEKVSVAESTLKNRQWLKQVVYAGQRVGTVDILTVIQAETSWTGAKTSLEAARKALADAYQKFNQMTGYEPEDRPVLVDRPKLVPLEVKNLDVEINAIVTSSPTLWSAEQGVELAKLTKRLYDFTNPGAGEPYEVKDIDLQKAEVTAGDVRDQMAKQLRTMYYTAKQLEEQYSGVVEGTRLAGENLRVAKVKFDVGVATKTDVLNAELALEQARQGLLEIECQHEILKMAFKKPWAYIGAS